MTVNIAVKINDAGDSKKSFDALTMARICAEWEKTDA